MRSLAFALVPCLVLAAPQAATTSSSPTSVTVSTAVASATAPSAPLPSGILSAKQPTCNLTLFCPGYGLLETVQLSGLYSDSKTFVDKPALFETSTILQAFASFNDSSNATESELVNFVDKYFGGEGTNLLPANLTDFAASPPFLGNVTDTYISGFMQAVHDIWPKLARVTNNTLPCPGCETTLIPLNYSFIIPGSRFREFYYWDTFFIMEGLLASGLKNISAEILLNYFDIVNYTLQSTGYGFVPNGMRVYYLNRSQPPFLTQMLYLYTNTTNDTSLLTPGLSAIELEMQYWDETQSLNMSSPTTNSSLFMAIYRVNNTAPRPEGFLEDYATAYGGQGETSPNFNASQVDQLFRNLATGAESGNDYSGARWARQPLLNLSDNVPSLRTLNNYQIIPIDLNAILFRDYELLAAMYNMTGNTTRSAYWDQRATSRRAAIIELMWNATTLTFNDFNLSSGALTPYWTPVNLTPLWVGIYPDEIIGNQTAMQQVFAPVAYTSALYNGSIAASYLDTGLQWDFPSSWAPHTYFTVEALRNLPANLTTATLGSYTQNISSLFSAEQFGVAQSAMPGQPYPAANTNVTMPMNSTSFTQLLNVGNLTANMSWRDGLMLAAANRYTSGLFCSWYATGGSIPNLLPQLSPQLLNLSNSIGNTGNLFEKLDTTNLNAAGFGGEYTVQAGFGWSNGVALWLGSLLGANLTTPMCPPLNTSETATPLGTRPRKYV